MFADQKKSPDMWVVRNLKLGTFSTQSLLIGGGAGSALSFLKSMMSSFVLVGFSVRLFAGHYTVNFWTSSLSAKSSASQMSKLPVVLKTVGGWLFRDRDDVG